MLESIFSFLKNIVTGTGAGIGGIIKGFGNVVLWVFDKVIPGDVKSRFTGLTSGSFKNMIFGLLKAFAHWYFLMVVLALIVLYRLFKALKDTGIYGKFETIVYETIESVLYISGTCFPKIGDYKEFIECILDPVVLSPPKQGISEVPNMLELILPYISF
jgi:hypothetical protein